MYLGCKLKPSIKWEHYVNLFKIESNSLVKLCPKLTKHHFELNNLSKMKVKYAVQVPTYRESIHFNYKTVLINNLNFYYNIYLLM